MSTSSPATTGVWLNQFPGNLTWSNATLVTKGMAPYNAVALNEIDEVCERLKPRQQEAGAWEQEWAAMGERVQRTADAAEAAGHRRTAGSAYLRAGMYYFTAERFIFPGAEKRAMAQKALDNQYAGLLRQYPNMEKVEVPFEGLSLPGLFLKAAGSQGKPAPTVVVFNGMDNCKEMSILFCGLEFAARGWNTLAIDGPGQGESLRLRDIYARADFEKVGTAAFDYAASRKEVDGKSIVALGYSFGGYYAGRIAAFEQRYAAGVAFASPHWDLAAFQRGVRDKQAADPKSTAQSTFHFPWIMGCLGDTEAAIRKAEGFTLDHGIARKIRMPFLITHGVNDKLVPITSAQRLFDEIEAPAKALKIFTTEEGGASHCSVDNRPLGVGFIADWIGDTLAARR